MAVLEGCPKCSQGIPSVNSECWFCKRTFHIHTDDIGGAPEGAVIFARCPSCATLNVYHKRHGRLEAIKHYQHPPIERLKNQSPPWWAN